jgi:hypothetical protein
MSTKPGRSGVTGPPAKSTAEDAESSNPKPLTTTILQEFQNFKDKFKNEDETQEKGKLYCAYLFLIDNNF